MTRDAGRVPPTRGRAALSRVVGVDADRFAREHWGRAPLLSSAADLPRDFGDLFGEAAVDELVADRGLRAPFLRVARDGTTLGDRAFTTGGGVGAGIADQVSDDKVLRLFAGGATIVLQALHRTWAPVAEFSQSLAADLGHPVQVNAYVTPPQSTGFSDHYDVHDVFVLQVSGEKRWRVRAPVHDLPLRDQPWTERADRVAAAATEDPLVETTLRPGDCLYLPRGHLHSATALGGVSTHLTVGVHAWTRHDLVRALLDAALEVAGEDADVRASLPLGVDVTDERALADDTARARDALLQAVADVPDAAVATALSGRHRAAQRPAPVHPLAQLRAAAGGVPAVRARPHLAGRLDRDEAAGETVLRSRAGRLGLDADDEPHVRRLLDGEPVTAADAGTALLGRLLRAGVAVPDPGAAPAAGPAT